MRIRVTQTDLSKTLALVTSVVPTTSSIPVLSNLLLEVERDRITISATDLDISIISRLGGEISEPGSITVAARRLYEIIRELPGEEVDISADGNQITVTCSRATFKMMGMEKEQFPKIANLEDEERISIGAEILDRMIRRTVYAVAKDETRPVLSGILWELGKDEMSMVGTDGHRLARMAVKGNFGIKEPMGVIIPPKALNQVLKLLDGVDEISIAVDKAFVGFFVGDTVIYSRRIEGTFPNYQKVIPENNQNILVADRLELMSATKRVSLLADSKTHKIKIYLGKEGLKLTASTPELGEAEEEVPATYSGDEMVVGYNASYILDVLKTTDADEIRFELGKPVEASVIKPASEPDGESYICLVMPLRLAEHG